MRKKQILTGLVLMGCMLGLFFADSSMAKGKTLRMRLGYDVDRFDPAKTSMHMATVVYRLIYNHLLDYKPGAWPELQNQLAENYEVSPDRLTYTFYLKKGVRWQKGYGELTAEDVKFSVERIIDPKTKAPLRSVFSSVIDRVETPDTYTVKFHLSKPDLRYE